MISYHPEPYDEKKPAWYTANWLVEPSTDLEVIADVITRHVWSPCMFRGGYRKEKNFMRADYLTFDFENKDFPLEKAFYEFKDYSHIIGTTRNHRVLKDGEVKDRFRVLIKFEEPIKNLKDYLNTLDFYLKYYPADHMCSDGARLFYPCKEVVSVRETLWGGCNVRPASPLDLEEEKNKKEKLKEWSIGQEQKKIYTSFVLFNQRNVIPVGHRNDVCHRMAKDLIRIGYSEKQTLDFIRNSATYGGVLRDGTEEEIKRAIRSAWKSVTEERV